MPYICYINNDLEHISRPWQISMLKEYFSSNDTEDLFYLCITLIYPFNVISFHMGNQEDTVNVRNCVV